MLSAAIDLAKQVHCLLDCIGYGLMWLQATELFSQVCLVLCKSLVCVASSAGQAIMACDDPLLVKKLNNMLIAQSVRVAFFISSVNQLQHDDLICLSNNKPSIRVGSQKGTDDEVHVLPTWQCQALGGHHLQSQQLLA